jgi:hypothetical protein
MKNSEINQCRDELEALIKDIAINPQKLMCKEYFVCPTSYFEKIYELAMELKNLYIASIDNPGIYTQREKELVGQTKYSLHINF